MRMRADSSKGESASSSSSVAMKEGTPSRAQKLASEVESTAESRPEYQSQDQVEGAAKQGRKTSRRWVNPLHQVRGGDGEEQRPQYRPRSAGALTRIRLLKKYLPGEGNAGIRKQAEAISDNQFNYLLSTAIISGLGIATGAAAWFAWPYMRDVVFWFFSANDENARAMQEMTLETQYLAAVSTVTAVLLANTMAFAYNRQRQIVSEISEEIFAIELLLQELFISVRKPTLRWRVVKHIQRYIDVEIQARDIDSPFRVDGAILGLFNALVTLRAKDVDISKMTASAELLARANSRRSALAAALLPPLHWVMLASLCVLLVTAFLLFDSDFGQSVVENRIIFASVSAMLVIILKVLQDISAADEGLYSVRDAMENRLTYVRWQMDNIMADPAIKLSMLDTGSQESVDEEEDEAEHAHA